MTTDCGPDRVNVIIVRHRDGKSYKRYKHCWCKEFPTGIKILVERVIKGGVKNWLCRKSHTFGVNFWVLKSSWCKFLPYPSLNKSLIIICSLDAFFSIKDVFILFSIEFVANHVLLVALNLSWIMRFWCKFLGPKKCLVYFFTFFPLCRKPGITKDLFGFYIITGQSM